MMRDRSPERELAAAASEARLTRYLLGQLPADERLAVEQSLFTDPEVNDQIHAVRDDLIQAYLAGALAPEDWAGFEAHFLTVPWHRERVAFFRDMLSAIDQVWDEDGFVRAPGIHRRRLRPWALAAALIVAIAGILAMLVTRWEERESRQASAPPTTVPAPVLGTPEPTPHIAPQSDEVRVLELPRRAAARVAVALTPRTRWLQVEVAVDPEPISFEVSVQTRHGGKEVWRPVGISAPAAGKPLVFRLPTSILAPGDFLLFVRGAALREAQSPLQEYSLRVSYIDASATPNGASPH